ncbi:L,D-transpeptidase family protein [Brevundimonas sp.]|uniref:L,D-transpeptidase family protein n=1 Tax=Brevundimonas sp. TaxID=1871086 RepID=UPI003D0A7B31
MIRPSLVAALLATVSLAACGAPDPKTQAVAPNAPTEQPTPAGATGALSARSIEAAVWQPTPAASASPSTAAQPTAPGADPATPAATTPPRPEIIRAQILLDRARFSPGAIDGLGGENTRQAVAAFAKANGLQSDGDLNAEVFAKLTHAAAPVTTQYTITAADVAGPFAPVPEGLEAQAELTALNYASPLEGLAEKFHVTEALLTALNPGADFARAGQTIVVPAISAQPLPAAVTRILVSKADSAVRAFGADGTLLAFYPATIGSSSRPAPTGRLTVVGVAPEPNYTYDPDRLTYGTADRKFVVAAGPNNPVGAVWIDLSRDTYGIHGTPDPSKIAKTASNGCVRLTNWSAEQLAASVKPGVEVIFS